MISDARGQDEFTIYLTNGKSPEDPKPNKLLDFFRNEKQAGKKYKTAIREEGSLGIAVDLGSLRVVRRAPAVAYSRSSIRW